MSLTTKARVLVLCAALPCAGAMALQAQPPAGTFHCRMQMSVPSMGRLDFCILYRASEIGQAPGPGVISRSAGICREAGGTWVEGCCPAGWKFGCHRPSGVSHYYYEFPANLPAMQCNQWDGDLKSPVELEPGDPLMCEVCDPTGEAAIESVQIATEICDGCVLDARGTTEIKLQATAILPGASGLTAKDVTWSVTSGDGSVTPATGLTTTYTHGGNHAGQVTIKVSLCDSSASVTLEAAPIVVDVQSADGEEKKLMVLGEKRKEPLETAIAPTPIGFNPAKIKWRVYTGLAGRLVDPTGATNTLEQKDILSNVAYDTGIHAAYGDNEYGKLYRTSNHEIRPLSALLPNSHEILTDKGEPYIGPGWVKDRKPKESLPAAFTRRYPPAQYPQDQKAELELEFEIEPRVPADTLIQVRAAGLAPDLAGALGLDPFRLLVEGETLRLPPAPAKEPFPNKVSYHPNAGIEFEVLFEDAPKWVAVGQVQVPIYVLYGDPVNTEVYETPLHIGATQLEAAGTPPDFLSALQAMFGGFKSRSVTRVRDETQTPLEFWGPTITDNLQPRANNPNVYEPPSWAHTVEGLLEHGAGTCGAWSDMLRMTFNIQGFSDGPTDIRFGVFNIGPKRKHPVHAGWKGSYMMVKNWVAGRVWGYTSTAGLPAQGRPEPTDLEKKFSNHVIVRTRMGTKGVIFDPSYGTETLATLAGGGHAVLEETLRLYEDATMDFYVISKDGDDSVVPNQPSPTSKDSEMEYRGRG